MIDNEAVFESLLDLVRTSQDHQIVTTEKEHFLVKGDGELVSLAEFQYAEAPLKKIGNVRTDDVASFNSYYKRFADKDSIIFASPANFSFTSILDYHEELGGQARRCGHKVSLTLQLTDEFQVWQKANNVPYSQDLFAAFIEDHLPDIWAGSDGKYPSQADMVEISRSLTATMGSSFKQESNLQNGQRVLSYLETIQGAAGPKGELAVPEKFCIFVKVFVGQRKTPIECRLRYRINQGKLVMYYQLMGIADILRCEFDDARAGVEKGCGLKVLLGVA